MAMAVRRWRRTEVGVAWASWHRLHARRRSIRRVAASWRRRPLPVFLRRWRETAAAAMMAAALLAAAATVSSRRSLGSALRRWRRAGGRLVALALMAAQWRLRRLPGCVREWREAARVRAAARGLAQRVVGWRLGHHDWIN